MILQAPAKVSSGGLGPATVFLVLFGRIASKMLLETNLVVLGLSSRGAGMPSHLHVHETKSSGELGNLTVHVKFNQFSWRLNNELNFC